MIEQRFKKSLDESEDEYIYRICGQKNIIGDWYDVADILNEELGHNWTESAYRKRFQQFVKMFEANKNRFIDSSEILNELELKKIELQKEKQKFFDQRQAYNKLLRERARQEELNEIIERVLCEGALPSLPYDSQCRVPTNSENDLVVSLCDLHYGADINNAWNVYNSDVCAERLCKYAEDIITVKKRHNSENCYIWANGDLISGNIHYEITVTNKENVIKQLMGVSELIAQFIAKLSAHFKKIYFLSVGGNHSRLGEKDRSLQSERLDDLVEWYLQARLQSFVNVLIGKYNKLDPTMYIVNIRGLTYMGTHGDLELNNGQVLALKAFSPTPLYAVLSGHLHHNSIDTVQGVKLIQAGSFLGIDQFCVSKRIYGNPQQLICVCTDHGAECFYDVNF